MADFLTGYVIPGGIIVAQILVLVVPLLIAVAMLTYAERKVIAAMQLRKGPNRVGSLFGLLPGIFQPFADVIKLLLKEVVVPSASNKWLFRIAPAITLVPAFAAWAVMPLDPNLVIADIVLRAAGGLLRDRLDKDLSLYASNLEKMAQAVELMEETVAAERRRRERQAGGEATSDNTNVSAEPAAPPTDG